MKKHQEAIARILRKIADLVESASDEDLDSICKGEIHVQVLEENGSSKDNTRNPGIPSVEVEPLAELLRQSGDRAAAARILESHCPSKERLIQLARHLDVRAQKRDTVDRLKQKLIEATIGFRLRSEAIQGSKAG